MRMMIFFALAMGVGVGGFEFGHSLIEAKRRAGFETDLTICRMMLLNANYEAQLRRQNYVPPGE